MVNRSSFRYRIISGQHDKSINISYSDDVIIASKDSLKGNLSCLDNWLKEESEIYIVIDEAHHSTAKSYRKIIDYIRTKVANVKLLGLTATPFRTADSEQGLLGKIFTDGFADKIDLTMLVNKSILSRPEFKEFDTEVTFGNQLGLNDIRRIETQDSIPEYIATEIAQNKQRNAKIVREYVDNKEKYKQTLVFAVNRDHAIVLNSLFTKHGIDSAFIISGTKKEFVGIDVSHKANEENINKYRNGEIDVLINVNILTEGADLPKTQTVFLTRPTVSTTLMTQMIGRALRGELAGGTAGAYIVSFIDNWKDKIAWVNAEYLYHDEEILFPEKENIYSPKMLRMVSIAKIEEFAKMLDDTVDTLSLEKLDFIKRIPLGMYAFSYIENETEHNHQVLVYDSTKEYYEEMISGLPDLFKLYNIVDETLPVDLLVKMCTECEDCYFDDPCMIPTFDGRDINSILKFYAQQECEPRFIKFDEIDRRKVDLSIIAKEIVRKDLRQSEEQKLIDTLWEDESSLLKVYFNKKAFFKRQLEIEKNKLSGDYNDIGNTNNVIFDTKRMEELPLYQMQLADPETAHKIKSEVFSRYVEENGYICAECGKVSKNKVNFQIDHIKPMAKGGLTRTDNLQLLCRKCNGIKGTTYAQEV